MITTHTELLNALIEKYNLKSYLEIGVQTPEQNFDKINCAHKIGVDPALPSAYQIYGGTSDDWFKTNEDAKLDLIFVDGDHTKDQVKRDFENSLRCLSDNGFILIHDVLPENEAGTKVPRETRKWWGDVYKWAMTLSSYDGIKFKTFNIDNGCMLVWKCPSFKGHTNLLINYPQINQTPWPTFKTLGRDLMNVTDKVEV